MTALAAAQQTHRQVGVKIDDVTKVYQTRGEPIMALEECSLEMKPGEFVSVVGPSGCGKSTLLLMIAGLISKSSGTITIDGTEVTKPHTDLGIVFQEPVLLDWRKVMANVMLQVEIRRGFDKKALPAARAGAARPGRASTGFEDRYPSSSRAACASACRSAGRSCTTRRCC